MRWRALAALAAVAAALASTGLAKSYPACDGPDGRPVHCYAAKPDPPAPPPAPKPKPPPPWSGPGLHVAWGFMTGQYTPDQLATLMARSHFAWACLEGSPADYNEQYMVAFRDALHARGMRFCIWERGDRQKDYPESYYEHIKRMIETYHPDFYGADVEVFPLDDPNWPIQFGTDPVLMSVPHVLLVAGMWDAHWYFPFWNTGWQVMAEDYSAPIGQPPCPGIAGPVDRDAYWRGAPQNWLGYYSVPIIEIHSEGSADFQTQTCAIRQWGKNYSIWDAEQMTDADWAATAAYNQ